MRYSLAVILALAALAGCKTTDPVKPPATVVEVIVTKTVPVDPELAADCQNEPPREQTVAEAKRLALKRGEYLTECTARMRRIRGLEVSP